MKKHIKNILIMLLTILICFGVSLISGSFIKSPAVISMVFFLGVYVASFLTDGYIYGVISSIISVLIINYVYAEPYFSFDFNLDENLITASAIFIISVATATLAEKIKRIEKLKAENGREKIRADLLRAISHDLRTPLTSIFGAGTTITENYDLISDEDKQQMIKGITEDAQWLIRMVENLLSVTKVDDEEIELVKTSVVLEELIDSVLSEFKKRYPKFIPEVQIPEDFIIISADPILIEQVLLNLLENAVKHARGMTKLQLKVEKEEDKVTFEVTDNGCGIESEKLEKLFSGVFNFDEASSDSNNKNMGIGLSACAAIVKAHGKSLKAKNLRSGGMSFRFALDVEDINE